MDSNKEKRKDQALRRGRDPRLLRRKPRASAATVDKDSDDPAEQPLIEAGEGEAEGFELAEKDLEEIASHGDQHRFPNNPALRRRRSEAISSTGNPTTAMRRDRVEDRWHVDCSR